MNQAKPTTILLIVKRVDCNDGVASYLESLANGLRECGDRVVIVSGEVTTLFGSEKRRQSIAAAVVDWIVIDDLRAARPKPAQLRRIISAIERYGIDVLSPQGFAVLPLASLIGRITRRPVVPNFHLLPTIRPRFARLQFLAYRAVTSLCNADRYIAMSTEIELFFQVRCGIAKHRIHKQMLGVDTDFYRPPAEEERRAARERFALSPETVVAVLPGRLNLTKGHDTAAVAFRLLRRQRPQTRTVCLFAGAGDERETIEASVFHDAADRETFRFLGFVDRLTLRDVYWAADIVLLPSLIEGFGLVVAEAMCCGALVVRTRSGGWQDQVIEGTTGYAIPFNDPPALANAVERIIDAPNRRAMREAAMRLASSAFSRSQMIAGTSALYREVAATSAASRSH